MPGRGGTVPRLFKRPAKPTPPIWEAAVNLSGFDPTLPRRLNDPGYSDFASGAHLTQPLAPARAAPPGRFDLRANGCSECPIPVTGSFLRALVPVLFPFGLASRLFHAGAATGSSSCRGGPGAGSTGKTANDHSRAPANPDSFRYTAANRCRHTDSISYAETRPHLDADGGTHGHADCRAHSYPRAGAFSHAPGKLPVVGVGCHPRAGDHTGCLF